MNYVLPEQKVAAVACLVQFRARQVIEEVHQQVLACQKQSLGQSGYLSWSSVSGKVWGHFEEGRCTWLLLIQADQERMVCYRNRGDLDVYELYSPGHGGGNVYQRTEQLGLVTANYVCELDYDMRKVERKLRWFHLQRWFHEVRSLARERRPFPGWLTNRSA